MTISTYLCVARLCLYILHIWSYSFISLLLKVTQHVRHFAIVQTPLDNILVHMAHVHFLFLFYFIFWVLVLSLFLLLFLSSLKLLMLKCFFQLKRRIFHLVLTWVWRFLDDPQNYGLFKWFVTASMKVSTLLFQPFQMPLLSS
jgi:hypothetical protein